MPIAPKPFAYKCSMCGYRKLVEIKSDSLSPIDLIKMIPKCPKCGGKMKRKEPNFLDYLKKVFN